MSRRGDIFMFSILIFSVILVVSLGSFALLAKINRKQTTSQKKLAQRGESYPAEPKKSLTSGLPIYVQYHLWFRRDEPSEYWCQWFMWSQICSGIPGGVDPTHFFNPWRRITTSRLGLPLVGVYSSMSDFDTITYHFNMAKQAGIDGLFASIYETNLKPVFQSHLDIANNVGIKLGLEIYQGIDIMSWPCPSPQNSCVIDRTSSVNWASELVNQFANHPAFLKIDNKPAVWIANSPYCTGPDGCADLWNRWCPGNLCPTPQIIYPWGNKTELQDNLQQIENNTGKQLYTVMSGPTKGYFNANFSDIPQIGKIAGAENTATFWNRFGYADQITEQLSPSDSVGYENDYETNIQNGIADAGDKFALHAYPAFDERALFPTSQGRGSGLTIPRAVITRSGNGMYEANDGFLSTALDQAKKYSRWVFLESFNDWAEQTQIEPGLHFNNFVNHRDYFSSLRRVANFNDITNPNFSYPPIGAVDQPLIDYRIRQSQGAKVRLKGKFGFEQGANQTNGVALTVSYLDDDISYQTPTGGPFNCLNGNSSDPSSCTGHWINHYYQTKNYTGQLLSFDIDITSILDKPDLVFGIESLGDPNFDQIFLTEFKLDWYEQDVDLLNSNILTSFNWHSQHGGFTFPQASPDGTAKLTENIQLEDGNSYSNELYLHPNYDVPGNTFVQASIIWLKIQDFIPLLNPSHTPTPTRTPTPSPTAGPSPTPSAIPTDVPPGFCSEDVNTDHYVNLIDVNRLINYSTWNSGCDNCREDVNQDGRVSLPDLSMVINYVEWNGWCGE